MGNKPYPDPLPHTTRLRCLLYTEDKQGEKCKYQALHPMPIQGGETFAVADHHVEIRHLDPLLDGPQLTIYNFGSPLALIDFRHFTQLQQKGELIQKRRRPDTRPTGRLSLGVCIRWQISSSRRRSGAI